MNRVAICVLLWHYMNPMIYNIIVTPSWDAEILHYLLLLCVYYEITLLLLIIIIIVFYYYTIICCVLFSSLLFLCLVRRLLLALPSSIMHSAIDHYHYCRPAWSPVTGEASRQASVSAHIPLRRSTSKQTQRKKAISSIVCLIRLAFIVGFKAIVRILG